MVSICAHMGRSCSHTFNGTSPRIFRAKKHIQKLLKLLGIKLARKVPFNIAGGYIVVARKVQSINS